MRVGVAIVLANFVQHIAITDTCSQEGLFNLECFNLHIGTQVQFRILMINNYEELFCHTEGLRHSNQRQGFLETVVNLSLKALLCILNYVELGMANPRINQLLVNTASFFQSLFSWVVVGVRSLVKLLSAISGRFHVNDSLITTISQLDRRPAHFIQDRLPNVFIRVRSSVHNTTVIKNNRVFFRSLSDLNKNIFESHLQLHQVHLVFYGINETHFCGLDQSTPFFHNCCRFRHKQHSETHLN